MKLDKCNTKPHVHAELLFSIKNYKCFIFRVAETATETTERINNWDDFLKEPDAKKEEKEEKEEKEVNEASQENENCIE